MVEDTGFRVCGGGLHRREPEQRYESAFALWVLGFDCGVCGWGYRVYDLGSAFCGWGSRVWGAQVWVGGLGVGTCYWFGVQVLGCRVQGLGSGVQGTESKVQGLWSRVQGLGYRVWDTECRVVRLLGEVAGGAERD
jgi:hypothetical protein